MTRSAAPRYYETAIAEDTHLLDPAYDWKEMVLRINGFSPSGTFLSPYDFAIIFDGTYYSACNAFQVIYGGQYWDEDPVDPEHSGSGNGVDGTSLLDVTQAAVDNISASYGIVWLRDLEEPEGLELPEADNVFLISIYNQRFRMGNWEIYEDLENVDGQQFVFRSTKPDTRTAFALYPNGTPAGEWTTNFSMWNDDSRIFEISWSNDYLIQNLFHADVETDPHDWMWMMNSITFMHAYWNSGDPYVDLQHARVGIDSRFIIQAGTHLKFYNDADSEIAKVYHYPANDDFVVENDAVDANIVLLNSDTLWSRFTQEGDFEVGTPGKGVVLTNGAGTITKRVRLNDTGDGLVFEAV